MSVYSFSKSFVSVGGPLIEGFANVDAPIEFMEAKDISPVKIVQGIDGYVAIGKNPTNYGTLYLRLSQSSISNAHLSALCVLPVLDQLNLPITMKPYGRNDFYFFANGIINGFPDYNIGQETGVNQWEIICVGINRALLGG